MCSRISVVPKARCGAGPWSSPSTELSSSNSSKSLLLPVMDRRFCHLDLKCWARTHCFPSSSLSSTPAKSEIVVFSLIGSMLFPCSSSTSFPPSLLSLPSVRDCNSSTSSSTSQHRSPTDLISPSRGRPLPSCVRSSGRSPRVERTGGSGGSGRILCSLLARAF